MRVRHRGHVREIEPQPIGIDLGPLLLGVLTQSLSQCVVQDVRCRVSAANAVAAGRVDKAEVTVFLKRHAVRR